MACCRCVPGDLTFAHVQALVDDVLTVERRRDRGGGEMALRQRATSSPNRAAPPASRPCCATAPDADGVGRRHLGRKCSPEDYAKYINGLARIRQMSRRASSIPPPLIVTSPSSCFS